MIPATSPKHHRRISGTSGPVRRHHRGRRILYLLVGLLVLIFVLSLLLVELDMRQSGKDRTKASSFRRGHPDLFQDMFLFTWPSYSWIPKPVSKQIDQYPVGKRPYRIVFAGLAKNIDSCCYSTTTLFLERMAGYFSDYRIVIYENNSTDSTRVLLEEWAASNPRITILPSASLPSTSLPCAFLSSLSPYQPVFSRSEPPPSLSLERVRRMAYYRDQYLDHIRCHYGDFDLVMVMDMDLNPVMYLPGFMEAIDHLASHRDVDAIFPNTLTPMMGTFGSWAAVYDSYAYLPESARRSPPFRKHGHHIVQSMIQMNWQFWNDPSRKKKQTPFYPVLSAFNGFGLYRMSSLCSPPSSVPRYAAAGGYENNIECEHITLHRQLPHCQMSAHWIAFADVQGPSSISEM